MAENNEIKDANTIIGLLKSKEKIFEKFKN